VKANDAGLIGVFKMAFNGIAEHGFQFFERVRLQKDGMAEGTGFLAAFWRLLDSEK
jgi:hypothetical protein